MQDAGPATAEDVDCSEEDGEIGPARSIDKPLAGPHHGYMTTTETNTSGVVMVWADGSTTTGLATLRLMLRDADYYDEEPTEIYVNDNGHLVQVDIRQSQGFFDADDYATVTVRLVKKENRAVVSPAFEKDAALLTFTYFVDGRA